MWLIVWLQPLAAVAAIALAAAAVLRVDEWRAGALVQAAVLAGSAVALAVYAASEDHYRRDGTSRWEAYDVKELTSGAIALGALAALALFVAAADDRRRLGVAAFLVSSGASALLFVAFLGNSLN